jgi:LPXTG-motif cell wall-anchored protein
MMKKKLGFKTKKNEEKGEEYMPRHGKRKLYYTAGGISAAVVAIVTAYMLMMPGMTLEREPMCGKEEHIHDDDCYVIVSSEDATDEYGTDEFGTEEEERVLVCDLEEHVHTKECYIEEETEELATEELETEEALPEEDDTEAVKDGKTVKSSDDSENDSENEEDATECDVEEATESETEEVSPRRLSKARMADNQLILSQDDGTITQLTLSYKCPDASMTDWEEVTDDVELHGDDSMQLYLKYSVHISDIKASDYKMYYPLPDWMEVDSDFRDEKSDETGALVCVITAEDGYIVVTFDQDWLDSRPSSASMLSGFMSMEATFSIERVAGDKLVIGDKVVNVDYEDGKWQSTYGTININKSKAQYIEEDDQRDILQYTLTVTTGSVPMGNVKVEDGFSDTTTSLHLASMVEEIVDVTETETEISNTSGLIENSTVTSFTPGKISYSDEKLVWNIGDMQANETRTLTYQVRLKRQYTGLYHKNALVFVNVATLSTNDIERDTISSQFDAYGYIAPYKYMIKYTPNSDGIGGTITYAIKIQTDSSNTYTMDNIKLYDFASSNFLVDEDSFYLYDGDASSEKSMENFNGTKTKLVKGVDFTIEQSDGKFKNYTCYVGDFKPGQTKTLIYTAKLSNDLFLNSNGYFDLSNRVTVYEDDTKNTIVPSPNQGQIGGYTCNSRITFSSWEEKFNPVRIEESDTVQMDGAVYESAQTPSTETSFDVAAGYYQYRVILNQDGKLDINSVELKDTLSDYMQYAGYLRIDQYDTLEDETLRDNNRNLIDPGELTEEIQSTTWVNINGLTSFNIQLKNYGLSGNHAYVLTYYTKIVNTGSYLYVSVSNNFNMSGTVYGTGTYILGGINVKITSQAIVSSSCEVEKFAWYYERPYLNDTSDWNKGALYWYFKVRGSEIPEDAIFKDVVKNTSYHTLASPDSMVGAFVADDTLTLTTIEDLRKVSEEIDKDEYALDWDLDNNSLCISFPNGCVIPKSKAIYIVVKTQVLQTPAVNKTITYENDSYLKKGENDFQKTGDTASQVVSGAKACSKSQNDKTFIFDGQYCWNADNPTEEHFAGNHIYKNYKTTDQSAWRLEEPGTYFEYSIDTCKDGRLNGDVIFSDTIPEGLEIAFFRNGWFTGSPTPTADNVGIDELDEEIQTNPKTKWQRFEETDKAECNSTSKICIYYYNSETRELRWKLANVQVKSGYINFQLVVKVVDPEVLLGEKVGRYINTLTVYQGDGRFVEKDVAGEVTISRSAMKKTIDGSASGNIIPFKIVVNEFGEDLFEKQEMITMVDELGAGLTLDIDSISIVDGDGTELSKNEYVASVEKTDDKTYLKLTIPDDKKLTITYRTTVKGGQGDIVSISNSAHWEGYVALPDSEVKISNFTIDFGVDVSGHASVKLIKRDADDVMKKLAGAEFTMQAVEMNSDGTVKVNDDGSYNLVGDVHTATTDENGTLYFAADDTWMSFDAVYCITETKAPEGYDLDNTPYYILLATKGNTNTYPSNIDVQGGTAEFLYEPLNKMSAYEMPETGGIGTYPIMLTGGLMISLAIVWIYLKKRKAN